MSKKRKKDREKPPDDEVKSLFSSSDDDIEFRESDLEKYKPYIVTDYSRRYPEDCIAGHEYIVFVSCNDDKKAIGTRDMLSLSGCFQRFVKGIKYLKKVNKFKVGVVFDKPNLANAFLDNTSFLKEQDISASIPASSTELTGVITSVPVDMSNRNIFKALSLNTKKIISVRRIMRRVRDKDVVSFQPTQTVAITFASSTSLPDFVFLKMWRLPVLPYVPPVKQCFRCLRYGHLAKFCKNSERCSICGAGHSFKSCTVSVDKATCIHCKGNHIAISGQCPIKQKKITENKNKFIQRPYNALFNETNFPSLTQSPQDMIKLISDKKFLGLLTECLLKIISLNKTENMAINSQNIIDILQTTIQNNKT